MKENNIKFIKDFSSIRLNDILKKYKIDPSNFYHEKISEEKVNLIKKEIDNKIIKLYYESSCKNESKN